MEIYDYYKERYPQFDWESLNHHGFHMAIMKMDYVKHMKEIEMEGYMTVK